MRRFVLPVAAAGSLLAGCINLAPVHERPVAPVPPTWADRGAGSDATGTPATGTPATGTPATEAATLPWRAFIADARVREVVERALDANRDLRVAALNVERARGLYRIQESALLPVVQGGVGATRARIDGVTATSYSASVGLSYELDLFGRLRNLSDAAIASYLATREVRRATQVLLVAEVATAWLSLAADQERLAVARRTFDSQRRSLDLAVGMRDLGATTGLALAQVASTVEATRVQLASLETQIALDRNALELLVGGPVDARLLPEPGRPAAADVLFDVPAALPSSVLADRPDVRAAERALQAASANIGAARAAYFPRVTLTGAAGRASPELSALFGGGSGAFSIAPSISIPIFVGGLDDALAVARVDRDVALGQYERSVQVAFREVADVLAARGTLAERTAGQVALVDALATSFRLSDAVFRQGGSSYLQVLEAQRSLYAAQQALIGLSLEERTTRVALYRALGGGWDAGDR